MPPLTPAEEPRRVRILAAVATALREIQAGAQYWTTPFIDPNLLALSQYKTRLDAGEPILGVIRSSKSTVQPDSQADDRHDFRFAVHGYVRGDDVEPAGTWLERLWDDHHRCLRADPKLGGLVIRLQPDPEGSSPDTDEGELEPYARFVQDWVAFYTESFD